MAASLCLIRNSETYGIPGGWKLKHPALDREVAGRSPADCIAELTVFLRINNIAATQDQLWQFANETWGRIVIAGGQADRWMGGDLTVATVSAPLTAGPHLRRILTPKDTGPSLWGTLHLIPLVWTRDRWIAHIDLMTALIEPGGYESGCRLCAGHWKSFQQSHPAGSIPDAKGAAYWSWMAHNSASGHAGNKTWTWREAAAKWGWPGEWE